MKTLVSGLLVSLIAFTPAALTASGTGAGNPNPRIEREVRHELVMLPYYSVFDHLAFEVDGGTVILSGKVVKPALKDDAERAVKHIGGIDRVENRIQVLPLSPSDDRIRMAAYRAIYGAATLNRYAHQAVPPIHIIVENGSIALEGIVASEADRNLAYMRARGVRGAFAVTNHLQVEGART